MMIRSVVDRSAVWPHQRAKPARLAGTLFTLLLSSCASFSPDGGMADVADISSETIHKEVVAIRTTDDAQWANDAVRRLLSRPLSIDSAVQIALLNNRGLQAAYNELALAEADLVQEGLPPNPTFSISRISGDGAIEIERQIVGDILALATLPFRTDIARERFRKAQLRAAEETLRLVEQTAAFLQSRGHSVLPYTGATDSTLRQEAEAALNTKQIFIDPINQQFGRNLQIRSNLQPGSNNFAIPPDTALCHDCLSGSSGRATAPRCPPGER